MDTDREIIVVKQQNPKDTEKIWYVKDFSRTYGPLSWPEIENMYRKAKITPFAKIRKETWPKWVSLASIFIGKAQEDMETKALDIRKEFFSYRYIAMHYFGFVVFFLGIYFFILRPFYGIVLFIVSLALEVTGYYFDQKYVKKTSRRGSGFTPQILLLILQILMIALLLWLRFYK